MMAAGWKRINSYLVLLVLCILLPPAACIYFSERIPDMETALVNAENSLKNDILFKRLQRKKLLELNKKIRKYNERLNPALDAIVSRWYGEANVRRVAFARSIEIINLTFPQYAFDPDYAWIYFSKKRIFEAQNDY